MELCFHLLTGSIAYPQNFEGPFAHVLTLPSLEDFAEVDVTPAFQEEGVDIDGLIRLNNATLEENVYVVPKADTTKKRITAAEIETRWKECLGRFKDEIGTLIDEINFTELGGQGGKRTVKFHAPVYLANQKRYGINRPPTFMYDTAFETEASSYQRRVQIAQEVQPGETDRFTIKVAVARSSFHRFRVKLKDISGLMLESLPIEMICFVPRSRKRTVQNRISPTSGA